ncbi:MAG: hypothetical protein V1707_02665 [bacterium]
MYKTTIYLAIIAVLGSFIASQASTIGYDVSGIIDQVEIATLAGKETMDIKPSRVTKVLTTAYSSTPDQTDATPFITAKGTEVRDGVIAANWLPFGSKVRFPDISPDKIYIVEDRMHPRFDNRIDIWMSSREQAIKWGAKYLTVEIWYPAPKELASRS